ncbi:hypothetical protein AB6D20_027450 (plasmid) [Vibrio splendidus]
MPSMPTSHQCQPAVPSQYLLIAGLRMIAGLRSGGKGGGKDEK